MDNLTKIALAIQKIEGWYPASKNRSESRAYRNNNPGNIEHGSFAKSNGSIKSDGRFAIFPSYEIGLNALKVLISTKYLNYSISGMIAKYAPSSENNSSKYAKDLANLLGVSVNTTIREIISGDVKTDSLTRKDTSKVYTNKEDISRPIKTDYSKYIILAGVGVAIIIILIILAKKKN